MNDDELRIKIYEYLGLELGSLNSEGGNDWIRAEKEVLADYKKEQLQEISRSNKINFSSIDKSSPEFQFVLNTDNLLFYNQKIIISSRNDLNKSDLKTLVQNGSKDIIINIVRTHQLDSEIIDLIIPNSVYLTKKYLIEKQKLSGEQKNLLKSLMLKIPHLYDDLLHLI